MLVKLLFEKHILPSDTSDHRPCIRSILEILNEEQSRNLVPDLFHSILNDPNYDGEIYRGLAAVLNNCKELEKSEIKWFVLRYTAGTIGHFLSYTFGDNSHKRPQVIKQMIDAGLIPALEAHAHITYQANGAPSSSTAVEHALLNLRGDC